jgi:integrase
MQARFKFTEASIARLGLPPAEGEVTQSGRSVPSKFYWDEEIRGFGLRVGRGSDPVRSFIVQKDIRGRTRRVTIGKWPTWRVGQDRERARELIVQMGKGIDPVDVKREEAARGVTLEEAVHYHQAAMRAKRCAQRSINVIREEAERHLSDWLGRPLSAITRNERAQRHERLSAESGPYAANRVLQNFRAVYNTASRRFEELPDTPPTVSVTFNRVRRRREPIPWADLPDWFSRVQSIGNPVRRDLQLFILLTGLRATDAKTGRWVEGDFDAGTLHRPKPKGGEDRAFTVPVSTQVLDLLRRRRDGNHVLYPNDGGWVFPSRDMKGRPSHVAQAKEQRYDPTGRKVGYLPSPHRLRDTFATAGHEARLHPLDLKVLMNHSLPAGDVTEGYNRPSVEHLRESAQRVAEFLESRFTKVNSGEGGASPAKGG